MKCERIPRKGEVAEMHTCELCQGVFSHLVSTLGLEFDQQAALSLVRHLPP